MFSDTEHNVFMSAIMRAARTEDVKDNDAIYGFLEKKSKTSMISEILIGLHSLGYKIEETSGHALFREEECNAILCALVKAAGAEDAEDIHKIDYYVEGVPKTSLICEIIDELHNLEYRIVENDT
jgi:hypothetical protein